MTDLASSSPPSSLGSYRHRQALSTNARGGHHATLELTTVDTAVAVAAVQVLPDLPISADPCVVFTELARLLVPTICDEATVVVQQGGQLARRTTSDPDPGTPPDVVHPDGNGWRLTVHTAGGDGEPVAADYAAVLTCRWHSPAPTAQQVLLVQFAARHAALLVHHTGQTRSLDRQQQQVDSLRVALDSNRMIGAAIGVLMATRQLTYQQALDLLDRTSQNSNTKLAAVADTVLRTGCLPNT